MDTDRLDVVESLQCALQFAFHRRVMIDCLAEVRTGPVGSVEQFEAEAGVAREALRSCLQARGVEFFRGNEHARSIRRKFVGNVLRRQTAAERLRILRTQSRVEGYVLRLINQAHEKPERERHGYRAAEEQELVL